jgi:50S ribosomal subunit-associated GTPase HflX
VLFVIDASDNTRLEEAGFELDALISEKVMADIPVAILLNKCDLEEALLSAEICQRIKYDELQRLQGEDKIAIFQISVLRGEGYQAAFQWVANFL